MEERACKRLPRVWFVALTLLLTWNVEGANPSKALLSAAAQGDTGAVAALLGRGANVEARDKKGRTPLMLAAQGGYAQTVRLLLSKGAKADARDRAGWTAYGLALMSSSGCGGQDGVLKDLPQPGPFRLAVYGTWAPMRLISSCFMSREELLQSMDALRPEGLMVAEFGAYTVASSKKLVEIAAAGTLGLNSALPSSVPAGTDAILQIELQPGAACGVQSRDSLSLTVEVRLYRARDRKLLFDKSFGGGLKGLHEQSVDNFAQYAPVYQAWLKPKVSPIYWAVTGALLRSTL